MSDAAGSKARTAGTLALAVLGAQQFIMAYDTVSMNVAIQQLVADLGTTLSGVQSAIAMYALVMAAFMVTGSKLADRWGRRRAFTVGALLYGVGAGITALSPNLVVLAFGWSMLEGLGAAIVTPAILTLVTVNFAGTARARAFAVIGAMAAVGAAIGPILAGFLTTYLSWRVSFAAEVVVVLFVVSLRKLLAESRPESPHSSFDWGGVILSATGFAITVLGVLQATTYGFWTSRHDLIVGGVTLFEEGGVSPVPVIVSIGLFVLLLFVVWERARIRGGREPLVHLSVFGLRPIRLGIPAMSAQFLVQSGILFSVPVFLQLSLGYNAIESGITVLPLVLTLIVATIVSTRLRARVPADRIVRLGLLVLCLGCALLAVSIEPAATKLSLAPSLVLVGAGLGLVVAPLQDLVQSAAPHERASEVAGVSRSLANLGSSLGTALAGAVLVGVLIASASGMVERSEVLSNGQKARVEKALEGDVQVLSNSQLSAELRGVSPETRQEIERINADARNEGLQAAAASLALVSLLAFLLAFKLRTPTSGEEG